MGWHYLKKSILFEAASGFRSQIARLFLLCGRVVLASGLELPVRVYRFRGSNYLMPRFVRLSCGPSLKLK